MAIFVDYPCDLNLDNSSSSDPEDGGSGIKDMKWSKHDRIAAVTTTTNNIYFIDEEGSHLKEAKIERDCEAECIEWHPRSRILGIGWEDGRISTWVIHDGQASNPYSNDRVHSSPITFIKWNPAGTRLITGDINGLCCVWKADSRGRLTPAQNYRKKSSLTSAVFTAPSSTNRSAAITQTFSPSFFFGTRDGTVCYADDLGHCSDVQNLSSSVDYMMFYDDQSKLIIITKSLYMIIFRVNDDGRVFPSSRVKLSIISSPDDESNIIKHLIWAGPGILAGATGEEGIRIWDLSRDESYMLHAAHFTKDNDIIAKRRGQNSVISVAFNPIQRYLSAGTTSGYILTYRYQGEYIRAEDINQLNNQNNNNNNNNNNKLNPYDSDNNDDDSDDDTWGAIWDKEIKAKEDKKKNALPSSNQADDWACLSLTTIPGLPSLLSYGPGQGLLCASLGTMAFVFSETILHYAMKGEVCLIQTNSKDVVVEFLSGPRFDIELDMHIKGMATDGHSLVVWDGKLSKSFELTESKSIEVGASSQTNSNEMVIRADSIYRCVDDHVEICNLQGFITGEISFTETEGNPIALDINGDILAVATDRGYIKTLKVSLSKPKPDGRLGHFVDSETGESLGMIKSIRVNKLGDRISILSDKVMGLLRVREPDSCLYVYNKDQDIIVEYDFSEHQRKPISHFWDSEDPRYLVVEAQKDYNSTKKYNNNNNNNNNNLNEKKNDTDDTHIIHDIEVFSMFVTTEYGFSLQDSIGIESPYGRLISLSIPKLYFTYDKDSKINDEDEYNSSKKDDEDEKLIISKTLRDFVGLEDSPDDLKSALLDFSFYLSVGEMDDAYRAIKSFQSTSVWENMAHVCVKTKRLDVAQVCLGNMGYARGAAALRVARNEPEVEAQIAMLALQLGLIKDASRLYYECDRFDLLNKMYQATGMWEKALKISKKMDRIHLKTTHHLYAQHLESIGDIEGAMHHYEQANTFRKEIPRMLAKKKQWSELEDYVLETEDIELLKWWGGYMESKGKLNKAMRCYTHSNDYLSMVRVACADNDLEKAIEIVEDTNDPAASYHLARYLESINEINDAITYYAQSQCYNHAIRLAKIHDLDSELMTFALKSRPGLMIDCAHHFENKGELVKAAQLYQKGGDLSKAIEICFNGESDDLMDMLNQITESLGDNTSPQMLARCAEFFISHKRYDKAVRLFITGKKILPAIELCLNHKVKITDSMVEEMMPEKTNDPQKQEERKQILKALGKVLKKQGAFKLATKIYTQAGERIKALKCLLKSGDNRAIMFYAQTSRDKDIYILAANYFQSLDWHSEPKILKAIVTFYTKAKAYEQLASFYEAAAQIEIDDYNGYDEALTALNKGVSYIMKSKSSNRDDILERLQRRISMVERFVEAKRLYIEDNDSKESLPLISELLRDMDRDNDSILRFGDVIALRVEINHQRRDMDSAYDDLCQMKDRGITLSHYIDELIINEIYNVIGVNDNDNNNNINSDDDIEEDIVDEIDDDIDEDLPFDSDAEISDDDSDSYK